MQSEKLRAEFCIRFTRMFSSAKVANMVCRLSSAMKLKSFGSTEMSVWWFLKMYRGVSGWMVSNGPITEPGASGVTNDLMCSSIFLFWMGLTVLGWMTLAP